MPTQRLYPDADISNVNWIPEPASPTTLWDKFTGASDGKNAATPPSTFAEPEFEVSFQTGITPATTALCTLAILCKSSGNPGQAQDLYVEVKQAGSMIASTTFTDLPGTYTLKSFTFSSALVSDWSALSCYVVRLNTLTAQFVDVDQIYLDTPPWGVAHLYFSGSSLSNVAASASGYLIRDGAAYKAVSGVVDAGALLLSNSTLKVWDGTPI